MAPLPVLPGFTLESSIAHVVRETWTAADSTTSLTADHPWTRLVGVRWGITDTAAHLKGGASLGEIGRCDTELDRDDYTVSARLASLVRGSADDVSLGVFARSDGSAAITGYQFLCAHTALGDVAAIWRYLSGVGTQLDAITLTAATGQRIALRVRGTTQTAYVAGVAVLSTADTTIPTGRFGGITGYWQGGIDAVLKLDDWQMGGLPLPLDAGLHPLRGVS